VKHWQETAGILSLATREAAVGRRAAVATVIRIRGSAYRRPGARLLVREDGRTSGSVSGGCLESDVREVALAVLREGTPRLLHYDTGSDDRTVFGLGLGCNGSVDIFVQPATDPAWLQAARRIQELLAGDEPFSVSTVLGRDAAGRVLVVPLGGAPASSTGDFALDGKLAASAADLLRRGETGLHEVAGRQIFTEVLAPPPHLVLFGAGDDAVPLARFALEVGLRVSVVDHRPAFLSAGRFVDEVRRFELRPEQGTTALPVGSRSCAVVKTHSLEKDREWVRQLLATEVRYIGVLGPRARTKEILRQAGAASDGRVFGPVGLDLGAEGPEQVALSIVAELLAVWSGRAARHLREKDGPIHAG
jgi:xanthine dehydrogenase accessory factor